MALYKDVRELVHTGEVVRAPQHDPAVTVHGVVAPDRSDALFALVQLTSPETSVPGAVRLPGLDPARRYRVQLQPPGDLPAHMRGIRPPPWTAEGITLPGSVLGTVGLRSPALFPEQLLLIHRIRVRSRMDVEALIFDVGTIVDWRASMTTRFQQLLPGRRGSVRRAPGGGGGERCRRPSPASPTSS